MNGDIREKLLYLLMFMDHYMERSIQEVLEDSEEDPRYSAVTANNLVKCYADVMRELGMPVEFEDIQGYMAHNMFSEEEIASFLSKKQKEAEYYIGKQF